MEILNHIFMSGSTQKCRHAHISQIVDCQFLKKMPDAASQRNDICVTLFSHLFSYVLYVSLTPSILVTNKFLSLLSGFENINWLLGT